MKHLRGLLVNIEINQHTIFFHHNPHPITLHTNNPNNGTILVGRVGHLSILLLNFDSNSIGHKGGEDSHALSHNLYLHLIILILGINQISSSIFLNLYLQFLSLHNNLITSEIQILWDRHYYLHNRYLTLIINQLKLLTILSCKLFHPTLFWLYLYMTFNYGLEELIMINLEHQWSFMRKMKKKKIQMNPWMMPSWRMWTFQKF